jgi:malonate transporter and related proteins
VRVVLEVIAPVFLIIGLGFAAARWRFVETSGFRGLNAFAFSLASPALLFLGGTTGPAGGGTAALAFFLGTAVVYLGTLAAARRGAGMPLGQAGMLALDAGFGNTVMMGIPLVAAAFGAEALAVLLAILALHSLAQRYRIAAERSGATVLVGMVLSVATLSALLGWFRVG